MRCVLLVLTILTLGARRADAQDHAHHEMPPATRTWAVSWHAEATLGLNAQQRLFTDFRQIESQNWMMTSARRTWGRSTIGVVGMFSLEPFTLRREGSAQVFQTGETLDGSPLIDYQHPHDLFMTLETTLERSLSDSMRMTVRAAPVGSIAFGPTAFMHRASAFANPTAPLAHHHLDSTHISRSVITGGLTAGHLTVESSIFNGEEPDEDRLDLDLGTPDSVAGRVGWRTDSRTAQLSLARVRHHDGDSTETKVTASAGGRDTIGGRTIDWLIGYGLASSAEPDHEPTHAVLAEAAFALSMTLTTYGRIEVVDKAILNATHELSRVGAFTIGLERVVSKTPAGAFALGGDITAHAVPANLAPSYGRPWSVHVGLRYRFAP